MSVTAQITTLLTKQDAVEKVARLIADVLTVESANQGALALAEVPTPFDPLDYTVDVFLERWRPWETWRNNKSNAKTAPVVNVWISQQQIDPSSSNRMERQAYEATFFIDVYAAGRARADGTGGQVLADQDAGLERNRAAKIVRNFLAASGNIFLQNRGANAETPIWQTSISTMEYFVPAVEDIPYQSVKAVRLTYLVKFSEHSPQPVGDILELASTDITTVDEFGQVHLAAEVDIEYPLTP